MFTKGPLEQAIGALNILPVQISIIPEITIRLIIKAKTLLLLFGTLIIGVVRIIVRISISPALMERLAVNSLRKGLIEYSQ